MLSINMNLPQARAFAQMACTTSSCTRNIVATSSWTNLSMWFKMGACKKTACWKTPSSICGVLKKGRSLISRNVQRQARKLQHTTSPKASPRATSPKKHQAKNSFPYHAFIQKLLNKEQRLRGQLALPEPCTWCTDLQNYKITMD